MISSISNQLNRIIVLAGALVAPLILGASTGSDHLGPLVKILQETDDVQFQLDVLRGLRDALKGRPKITMPRNWAAVESELGASPNPEVQSLVRSLSLTFGSQRAAKALRRLVTDRQASPSKRRPALQSLITARVDHLPQLLVGLLSDPAMRGLAIRALARFQYDAAPGAILSLYPHLTRAEKRDALNTLASRTHYAMPLLDAVGTGAVPPSDLTAAIVRQLRNLGGQAIGQRIQTVWGAFRESSPDKQAEIARFRSIYRAGGSTPGDATRGRTVFTRICQQCHTLYGIGGKVGPDLTGSNRADLNYLLQNVVDPNAVIPNAYQTSVVETKDDRVITGIVQEASSDTLAVLTANETLMLPKDAIVDLQKSELSMMPEGLLTALKDQEIRDLLYYLRQPVQAPLIAQDDNLDLFFNQTDLTMWDGPQALWSVENGEIVGKTARGLGHNQFLASQMVFNDFRLTVEVKLRPNSGNSGIQFRSEPLPGGEVKGYQADIGQGWWGKLYEEQGRALLWDRSGEAFVKPEQWNTYEILALGDHIQTAINGRQCVDLHDPKGQRKGIIALQIHAGGPMEVRYRNFNLELHPEPRLKTVLK